MKILFIVLNDLSFQRKILELFIDYNVRGATILDSEGMAKAILEYEGMGMMFGGLFGQSIAGTPKASKTIFTVVKDDENLPLLIKALQTTLESSNEKTIGFMFTMPVLEIYPLKTKKN